ncbi:MAG: SUMF1/EgtB/PvdO family nonheme iron enzyme [Thiohalocapsa sp.]|nr:SUMF1/EgtB/PvdO family nonheme iron enzyme [Thiohalocapsa sp.]
MTGRSFLTASRIALSGLLALGSVPLQALEQDRYMLVLDASNSMWGQIEGRSKMDLAREVIGDLARDWPTDRPMGLVAYGHRDKRCSDIETLVPAETFDADRFVGSIDALRPRGRTPLTASLRHAAEALDYRNQPATLIVVSDGVESCGEDPCALMRQLEADNPSLTVHVVGFGLAADAADSQLACIAELSGGRYFTAGNQSELYQVAGAIFAATVGDAVQAERLQIAQERALRAQIDKLDSALASDRLEQAEQALQGVQGLVADMPEQRKALRDLEDRLEELRTARLNQEPIDTAAVVAPGAETAGDLQDADDAGDAQRGDREVSGPGGDETGAGTGPDGVAQAGVYAAEQAGPQTAPRREAAAPRAPYEPEMISLPGGCIQMGSPSDEQGREYNERRHRVCVEDFSIGKYEVTQAQWQAVMGSDPSRFGNCDDCPVESVSWTEANDYIAVLNASTGQRYRLPTEAEWEYAARAGTTTPFWSGTCIHTDQANYAGEYDYDGCGAKTGAHRRKTLPVGSLRSNPWGLYDVAGNVAEWTCSAYDADYEGAEQRCESTVFSGRVVLRGGSWYNSPRWLRSAARAWLPAGHQVHDLGFRLVRD